MSAPESSRHQTAETLETIFERQVDATPDAIALCHEDGEMSYRELDIAARRVAIALRRRGVGPGQLVGLCLSRSASMVVGILGILKSGAAYLPLDPDYPAERIAYMLRDGQPTCILTQRAMLLALREQLSATRVICVDDPELATIDADAYESSARARPTDPAYVIYTSGSTGRPKGVIVSHCNVVRLFASTDSFFQFDHRDVWTLFHSYAFDFSVWEIWGALLKGGKLVVVPYATSRAPEEFLELLVRHRVTVLNQTPSAFYPLIEACARAGSSARKLALRFVIFGGEALEFNRLQRWWTQVGTATRLVNMYGITETTVHVTLFEIFADRVMTGISSIGRPLEDLDVHLLDGSLRPVEVGETGEIYVSGPGLAKGYLNRAALTAERFIACPFGPPGTRMYRSGDLARELADGTYAYLGRADHQIKIRGFRIEPGEIEGTLLEHPMVSQAAVVAHLRNESAPLLVGYVVPNDGQGSHDSEASHVDSWRTVYEETYRHVDSSDDTSAFSGWNSSYDGQPIPLDEMRSWQRATISSILALQPRRVLEIGVGTGLLLRGIAPHVTEYWATDLSATTITRLRSEIEQQPALRGKVELQQLPAHDLCKLPSSRFDTIVINSVAQYFPSLDYLERVIRHALQRLVPGGRLFIGDIRNYALLRCFAVGVLGRRHSLEGRSQREARALVRELVFREAELLVRPEFFVGLQRSLPDLGGVQLALKRGSDANELTQYRYDVVLYKQGASLRSLAQLPSVQWERDGLDIVSVEKMFRRDRPEAIRLRQIPNRRLGLERRWLEALDQENASYDQALDIAAAHAHTVDPEELCALGERCGYTALLSWSGPEHLSFDAIFLTSAAIAKHAPVDLFVPLMEAPLDRSELANNPRAARLSSELRNELRDWLAQRLPSHMVPHTIISVPELPLTTNGKLDRKALPAPLFDASDGLEYGSTPHESVLLELVAQVLGLQSVGLGNSFFELGGDSLSAARLIASIKAATGLQLPVKQVFDAPNMAALAQQLVQGDVARVELARKPRPDTLPLSFAQQRLWLLAQLDPSATDYNVPLAFDIRGDVNARALRAALHDLVARHEILRTLIGDAPNGMPCQALLNPDEANIDFQQQICSSAELSAQIAAIAGQPFTLHRDCPIRARLLSHGPKRHTLVVVIHHIAADGWSLLPLVEDLSTFYGLRVGAEVNQLSALPVQYADYTLWQREMLGEASDPGSLMSKQLAYWTEALAGIPDVLKLPVDRARPARQSHAGSEYRFELGAELHARLVDLARSQHCTLFMILQAALAALLTRLGAGEDIPIGVAVAGRSAPALSNSIGLFVNTLVIRADTSGRPSFLELLKRVRASSVAAYSNQDVPFEKVVEALNPARSLSHNPLFQVLVTAQDSRAGSLKLSGTAVSARSVPSRTARFDLSLDFTEHVSAVKVQRGVDCKLEYATDLFDHATIVSITERYLSMLTHFVADPRALICDVPVLTPDEHQRLFIDWNETTWPSPFATVQQQFEAQAARSSDSPAVVFGDVTWSYRKLNQRADSYAGWLAEMGVAPGSIVGVELPRSPELVAVLLGVLKVGAAYLPLIGDHLAG